MMSFKTYRQHDQLDCGPTCLRMVAKHHGRKYSLELQQQKASSNSCLFNKPFFGIWRLFVLLFFVQCSNNVPAGQTGHTRILAEIPTHIQQVENLTIFPGDAQARYSIELIQDQTYGDKVEPYITKVNRIKVDRQGKVIIWDSSIDGREFPYLNRIYVFNIDGTYMTQIGRPGKGPGEYGIITDVQVNAGKVFIPDYTSQRLNVYNNRDYSFEYSTLIERWEITKHEEVLGMEFAAIKARKDSNLIVSFFEPNSDNNNVTYLLMDDRGNALSFNPLQFPSSPSIRAPGNGLRPSMSLSFMGYTMVDLSEKNEIFTVWTRDFLIKKYDKKGRYQSAIYYPIQGPPFDLESYASRNPMSYTPQRIERLFEDAGLELPETNPVIYGLIIDDENRIWVAVPAGIDNDTYEWWVLEESGELLAKLTLPEDQPIYDIKNGYLYSKKTNQDTGTEYVVKYRMEWTKTESN